MTPKSTHRHVRDIWRRIRHCEEDHDLSAGLALECATVLFHRLLADRAQGRHRVTSRRQLRRFFT
jgi:hypothetical protein